jgi:hypothetical protein
MSKSLKHSLLTGGTFLVLAISTSACASKIPGIKHNLADGACLYMKENNFYDEYALKYGQEVIELGKTILGRATKDKTPLCEIQSPAGVLLATANFIDQATLNAAKGVDAIERALGMKQTMENIIKELEQALSGENPAAQVNAKTVQASVTIGQRAKEIEGEINIRKADLKSSKELSRLIQESKLALYTANYYQAESAMGIRTFEQYWSKATSPARLQMIQMNSSQGITEELALSLPGQAKQMAENVVDTLTLAWRINKAMDSSSGEKSQREINKARREESKKATKIAKAIDARTTSTFAVATPTPTQPTKATQAAAPATATQPQAAAPTEPSTCEPAPEKKKNRFLAIAESLPLNIGNSPTQNQGCE